MKPKQTLKHWLIASAMLTMPWVADAAGLGKITVNSALGQPLRAEIELIAVPKDDIDLLVAKVASSEDYRRAGIERPEGLQAIKFSVEKHANGQPYIKLTSFKSVDEPYLQLLVYLEWPAGKILRNYTLLLDPPELQEKAATPAVSSPEVKAPAVAAKPAPEPAMAPEPKMAAPMAPAGKAKKVKEAARVPAKKSDVLVRAEPARTLTPAEQTFPRFEGEREVTPAPAAPAKIETPAPAKEKSYQVKQGDTLGKIAAELKPEGYSLDQMLVALFDANKQAFQDNNMNRLKSGQILKVPEADAVGAVAKTEATKEVKTHAANWNAYRQKLAGAVAEEKPAEAAPKQEAAGKITAKVEEKAPKAEGAPKDVLKLSKGESVAQGKGKADKALQDKLQAAQEDAAAKGKALNEANSRITDLEKNISDMQRLLDAQNKQMAELQKQAAAKLAPAPEVKPVAAAPAAEKPAEANPEAAKPEEAKPAEEAKPQEPLVKAEKPAEKPIAKKPRVVQPVEEPSFMEELLGNPLYLAGGGAVAIGGLLAALWAVGRRRKKSLASFEDSIMTGGDLKANTVFGNTGGGQIDTGDTSFLTDFSQGGMGAIDTNDVDPIAEAEVYMAYGRDAQAEEILKEAMNKDPNRHEVQLKLLEIYAGRRNQEAFETLASELYAATSGQGPVWEKAAELGRGLDANNPLYAGGEGAPAIPAAVAAAGAVAGAAVAAAEETPSAPHLDFNLDVDSSAGVPLDQATVPGEFNTEMPLEFNLDTSAPSAPAEQAVSEAPMEFDLGSIIPQAVEKQGEDVAEMPGTAPDLEFELPDLGELSQPQTGAAEPAIDADTLGGLDFQFDLDMPTTEAEAPGAGAPAEDLMPDLDLSNLDLEQPAGLRENVPLEEATTLAGPGESWEEASTKLDLARAYVEMGDKEGAREILEEVVQEGGPEQQADAKKLLESLA